MQCKVNTAALLTASEADTLYRRRKGTAALYWRAGRIRGHRRGRAIYLDARDVERELGAGARP